MPGHRPSPRPPHHRIPRQPSACPMRRSPDLRARELSRIAQLMAEVLAGERSPEHVRSLLSQRAYHLLRRRAGAYASGCRPRVRRTVLRTAGPGVTEVSAVVECGGRCRAIALRVTSAQHAWLCTHVETDVGRRMR